MNEKVKVSKQGRSNESLNPKIENINYFKIATSHGKRKKWYKYKYKSISKIKLAEEKIFL